MDIYSEKGTKVIYMGCSDEQVRWGHGDDPRGILIPGAVYTVDHTDVHGWHTDVYLEEYPGKKFNSVVFY